MSAIIEFYGNYVKDPSVNWKSVIRDQADKYTGKKSIKIRKSDPTQSIGTSVIQCGKEPKNLIIDPTRFLENGQVFLDCLHLLSSHEPGNELHLVPELQIPGGNVDFFLTSIRDGEVKDFVGIELQALDTTGSLWSERQNLLAELGIEMNKEIEKKSFGINWKMTAKTTLVQLHHKVQTFEHLNKHLVLVAQDHLINYMSREFNFSLFNQPPKLGDTMHIHSYKYKIDGTITRIELESRLSTDSLGLAASLGLRAEAKVEMQVIVDKLLKRISPRTLFQPIK